MRAGSAMPIVLVSFFIAVSLLAPEAAIALELCVPTHKTVSRARDGVVVLSRAHLRPQVVHIEDLPPTPPVGHNISLEDGVTPIADLARVRVRSRGDRVRLSGEPSASSACCELAGYSSFCAKDQDGDDEGVVVNFEVDTGSAGLTARDRRSAFVGGTNMSGSVALKPYESVYVPSYDNNGFKTSAGYFLNPYPEYKVVRVQVSRHKLEPSQAPKALGGADPLDDACRYEQIIGVVGTQVAFDVPNECIQVCNRRRTCSTVMFCSQSIPNPNGRLPYKFHFGVASFIDQTRSVELAMLDATDSEFATFDLSILNLKSCYFPVGENWGARGTVIVSANPNKGKYELNILDLDVTVGETAFISPRVPLPG